MQHNKMDNTEQLTKILASAPVGKSIELGGVLLKTSMSIQGCDGCTFANPEKANGCAVRYACMAHKREDERSVIFVSTITE